MWKTMATEDNGHMSGDRWSWNPTSAEGKDGDRWQCPVPGLLLGRKLLLQLVQHRQDPANCPIPSHDQHPQTCAMIAPPQ